MLNLGVVKPGSTLYFPFESFAGSTGAPTTISGFAVTDIQVYKDGGTTQRASTSGFTLLDTDGIDFDAITGINGFSIDLSDDTTSGFYQAGSKYFVVVSVITVDSQTMSFLAGYFRIGYEPAVLNTTIATLTTQTSFTLTSGPAENSALAGMWAIVHNKASALQLSWVQISAYTGATKTVTLAAGATFTAAAGDNISVMYPMPLQPTVVGRTFDVSATGEGGMDWGNVGSPSTTNNLSGTTVSAVSGAVGSVTGAVGSVTGNVGGNVVGSVASVTGSVGSVTGAVGSVTGAVGSVTGNVGGNVVGSVASVTGAVGSVTGNVGGNVVGSVGSVLATVAANLTQILGTALTETAGLLAGGFKKFFNVAAPTGTLNSIPDAVPGAAGGLLVDDVWTDARAAKLDNLDATISSRGTGTALDAAGVRTAVGLATANLDTQLSTIASYIDTEVAAIKAKTDNLPAFPAAVSDIPTVSQIWTSALTEAYRATNGAGTAAELLHEILQNLTEFSITSTTKTVKKFDGTTTAKTYTLDSATVPTSITETT